METKQDATKKQKQKNQWMNHEIKEEIGKYLKTVKIKTQFYKIYRMQQKQF